MRLLRTNLREKDVQPVKEQLAQSLFDHIPVSRWFGFSWCWLRLQFGYGCSLKWFGESFLWMLTDVVDLVCDPISPGRSWQQGYNPNGCQRPRRGLGNGDGLEFEAGYFSLLSIIVFSGRVTAGLKIRSIVRSMEGESTTRKSFANVELIFYQGCWTRIPV